MSKVSIEKAAIGSEMTMSPLTAEPSAEPELSCTEAENDNNCHIFMWKHINLLRKQES